MDDNMELSALFTDDELLGDVLALPELFSPTVTTTKAGQVGECVEGRHVLEEGHPLSDVELLCTPGAMKSSYATAPLVLDVSMDDVVNPSAGDEGTTAAAVAAAVTGKPRVKREIKKATSTSRCAAAAAAADAAAHDDSASLQRGCSSNAGGSKRRAVDLGSMDDAERAEFAKLEDRRRRNRIAAARSRRKKNEAERRERNELEQLRETTKQQAQRIAVLTAENTSLKSQVEFFKTWVTRTPSSDAFSAVLDAAGCGAHGTQVSGMAELAAATVGSPTTTASPTSCGSSARCGSSHDEDEGHMEHLVRRVRYRARKRHGRLAHRAAGGSCGSSDGDSGTESVSSSMTMTSAAAASSGSTGSASSSLRVAGVAGAAFALVFTFILSANLDTMAGQTLAGNNLAFGALPGSRPGLNLSPLLHDAAASAAASVMREAGALHGADNDRVLAAVPSRAGRVLHDAALASAADADDSGDADGVVVATRRARSSRRRSTTRRTSSRRTVSKNVAATASGTAAYGAVLSNAAPGGSATTPAPTADAARLQSLEQALKWAQATSFVGMPNGVAPLLDATHSGHPGDHASGFAPPAMWSPSAAVTFMLYAMGMKRFAEVILVNGLLLGIGLGVYSMVNKLRQAPVAVPTAAPSRRRRRLQRRHVHAHDHLDDDDDDEPMPPSLIAIEQASKAAARAAADRAALERASAVFSNIVMPTVPSQTPTRQLVAPDQPSRKKI